MLGRETEANVQSCGLGQGSGEEEERLGIAGVLVSYCCIVNHPKPSGLKQ